ncbi:TAXI family TRAP transporter solute-binding subunit [Caballeronia novacaledonica]|uniref:ABC transporter substrate-binding protein n=1 Tax=Caballeronia novacaledonica TaxID=1544861 RepID=A0AA37IEA0_9BURK|nr:TAXI family TRAP transporter solute-binding subunit [Caballeronia novacaledonica]GJH27018.1 ABC transporter substrate-binding protein [Caballeronia novacaledonica]
MAYRPSRHLAVVLACASLLLAILYVCFRIVDPLPPRRFTIASGIPGTTFDEFARQYAPILARNGVELVVRNYDSAVQHFDALRDPSSGVQAAFTTFGFTDADDNKLLYSLGGISDTPIFIFYRGATLITQFAQFRGRRLAIGMPRTAQRTLMLAVLNATNGFDGSTQLIDLEYSEAIEALMAGKIDVMVFAGRATDAIVKRALNAPEVRLMHIAQAEAIAKRIPGLKHVTLWRGIISLSPDVPSSDVDLLAIRNRILVRKDLHPALQYLLLQAMHEVHWTPDSLSRLGEFPSEQPNDLPLSPTATAFYHSGTTFWQRYLSFWLSSLLDRITFFVIPIVVMLIPAIGIAPRLYAWLSVRRLNQFHRSLGRVEREIERNYNINQAELRERITEIETAVEAVKVRRTFEVDLYQLRLHLRMVRERLDNLPVAQSATAPDN